MWPFTENSSKAVHFYISVFEIHITVILPHSDTRFFSSHTGLGEYPKDIIFISCVINMTHSDFS